MKIIEEIEKLLIKWKAEENDTFIGSGSYDIVEEIIVDLESALAVAKKPSNTQLKIDPPPVEHDESCDVYNIGGKCNCRAAWWRAT